MSPRAAVRSAIKKPATAVRKAAKRPIKAARRATSEPARKAGIKRAAKFTFFSVVGTILANAAALAATLLVGIQAPVEVISVTSLLTGAVAAGVQKSISWVDSGVDIPPPTTPTLANPLGGVQ